MKKFEGHIEIQFIPNGVQMKAYCKGKKGFLEQMKKLKEAFGQKV